MALAIEQVPNLAAWIRGEVPEWAKGVRYAAAHSLRLAVGDPYGQPFEHSDRYRGMRLLRAKEMGRIVGFALFEFDPERATRHLHFVVRDPACRGRRIGAILVRAVLDAMTDRPVVSWPLTEDGRLALLRWEFIEDDDGEWQYWGA